MRGINIGDEVYSSARQLFARVEETFPAAVCVKVGMLSLSKRMDLVVLPQLWRADDIENLSTCRFCGNREDLTQVSLTGVPFRVCAACAGALPDQSAPQGGTLSE